MSMFVAIWLALASCGAVSVPGDGDAALRGLDPVLLGRGIEQAGKPELAAVHGRFTYWFAEAGTREEFLADPERSGIQWGGACARMGPLSGGGSSERWTVYDGRIWVFASDACRAGFLAAPERYAGQVEPVPTFDPTTDTAALERGRALVERAAAAHGGAALDAADLRLASEGEPENGWSRRLETTLRADGRLVRTSSWLSLDEPDNVHTTTWVVPADGSNAYTERAGEREEFSVPAQREDLTRWALREPIALLRARHAPGFHAFHRGPSRLGDDEVTDVLVVHRGLATTLHLDSTDFTLRGISWRGRLDDGVTRRVVETFTETREVGGVRVPSSRHVVADGQANQAESLTWQTIELGPVR